MTQLERLRALAELRDPSLRMSRLLTERAMAEAVNKMEMIKGDPGYTPQKGVDYFTDDEVNSIIAFVLSQVKDGRDGTNGTNGKDGRNGIHGDTPIRGIDYWTRADIDSIVAETIKRIPKPKPITLPQPKDINYEDIKNRPDLSDVPKVIEFLKRGGFRGGGDTVAAGSNVTVTRANGITTIASSGGSGFTLLTATETPNGLLTVFTFSTAAAQPSFIVSDNVWMRATTAALNTNWTWNNGTKKATLTIPPSDDIFAVV